MADQFRIIPYVVRSAGTDVPPEEVQAGINSLAQQTTLALNSVASDPTGPAGGDLGGSYPNPTVVNLHVTGGTESGVAVTGNTINSSPIGQTTPAAGAFTTAVAGSVLANGGAVPAVTATATQLYNSPNPTIQFIDSIRSANNKNAYMQWGATVIAIGFANDAFTSFVNAFTITGGQASGVSGITSTSGTGAWAHTGGFSATGGINSTAIGQTTPAAGSFTTLTSSTGVGVASGGTGRTTLTAHAVLVGETTAAINQVGPGTTGQMLLGVTGADPAFGNNPTITGGTIDNAVVGGTIANTGAFTTLSTSGLYHATNTGAGASVIELTGNGATTPNKFLGVLNGLFTVFSSSGGTLLLSVDDSGNGIFTGSVTPSQTGGIIGTTTNNNANAGSVGEFPAPTNLTSVALTTATAANVSSISLSAGDWEVTGSIFFAPAAGTTVNQIQGGLNTTTATLPAITTGQLTLLQAAFTTAANQSIAVPAVRFSLAGATTVFLVAAAQFGASTMAASGFIHARRVR